jgi:N-acetyl-alpha-D-muramate 1-phosphate uridylyltransferase
MIKQAMVLAAGEGRRLRPLTEHTPKPLISIGGTTMLDHALDQLVAAGVEKCVVNSHYLADQIHKHLEGRSQPEITISHESELLNTGGGIANALSYFNNEPFFVLNADIWWKDLQKSCLKKLEDMWETSKMDALLLLVPREKGIGFEGPGDYFLASDGLLKHRGNEPLAPYIFPGISILHPRLFANQKIHPFSVVMLFHKAQEQGRLYGMVYDGQWGDMGTLESLKIIEKYAG